MNRHPEQDWLAESFSTVIGTCILALSIPVVAVGLSLYAVTVIVFAAGRRAWLFIRPRHP